MAISHPMHSKEKTFLEQKSFPLVLRQNKKFFLLIFNTDNCYFSNKREAISHRTHYRIIIMLLINDNIWNSMFVRYVENKEKCKINFHRHYHCNKLGKSPGTSDRQKKENVANKQPTTPNDFNKQNKMHI